MKNNTPAQAVEYVEIDNSRNGQRLDNFLLAYLRGVPRSLVYRVLRTGQVRVNKGRAKPSYKLLVGDIVRIPPVRRNEAVAVDSAAVQQVSARLIQAVLFENEAFMVLNKPSGMAVHGGSGLRYGLIEALKTAGGGYAGLELVHRLDRETSGCLMLSKNRQSLQDLHEIWRTKQVEKQYIALLQGDIRKIVTVDSDLIRMQRGGERMMSVAADDSAKNKSARTHIEPMQHYQGATLATIRIDTGRTHQIRVHCASIGHPLAGDQKYGNREFNKTMRSIGLKRLFLHAAALYFTLGETFELQAPLPNELIQILEKLDAR